MRVQTGRHPVRFALRLTVAIEALTEHVTASPSARDEQQRSTVRHPDGIDVEPVSCRDARRFAAAVDVDHEDRAGRDVAEVLLSEREEDPPAHERDPSSIRRPGRRRHLLPRRNQPRRLGIPGVDHVHAIRTAESDSTSVSGPARRNRDAPGKVASQPPGDTAERWNLEQRAAAFLRACGEVWLSRLEQDPCPIGRPLRPPLAPARVVIGQRRHTPARNLAKVRAHVAWRACDVRDRAPVGRNRRVQLQACLARDADQLADSERFRGVVRTVHHVVARSEADGRHDRGSQGPPAARPGARLKSRHHSVDGRGSVEHGEQIIDPLPSLVRLLLQASHDRARERCGRVAAERGQRRRRLGQLGSHDVLTHAGEWRRASQKLVRHRAECIHVASAIDDASGHLLRRHVTGRAHHQARAGHGLILGDVRGDRASHAEVRQERVTARHQDVVGLDVAVDDARRVRVRQRIRHFSKNPHRFPERQRTVRAQAAAQRIRRRRMASRSTAVRRQRLNRTAAGCEDVEDARSCESRR